MQKIVLATGNKGKVQEMETLLSDFGFSVSAQTELNVDSVPETGTTFIENAIIKARHAAKVTGLPAIADDSGLEVDALNGAPGIYSSRYAGKDGDDAGNIKKLLLTLKNTPQEMRTARFHCVLVYMRHASDPTPIICHGTWEGRITTQEDGENGFGYDPVFWAFDQECTSANLDPQVKKQVSHRGKALQKLLAEFSAKYQK